jgi:hypothetical protein
MGKFTLIGASERGRLDLVTQMLVEGTARGPEAKTKATKLQDAAGELNRETPHAEPGVSSFASARTWPRVHRGVTAFGVPLLSVFAPQLFGVPACTFEGLGRYNLRPPIRRSAVEADEGPICWIPVGNPVDSAV